MAKYLISFPAQAMDVPADELAAVLWAAKIAKACRCSQELREFMHDPEN